MAAPTRFRKIFCFLRQKCVMEDGTCVPGDEPSCSGDDMAVCYVDDQLVCTDRDECIHTKIKFALIEHSSMTDFLNGYNFKKRTIESALETAVGASPSQIYSIELHRTDDGTVYVTARADSLLEPALNSKFGEKRQFLYDGYGNSIGIDWGKSHFHEAVNPSRTECGPGQIFCFLQEKCVMEDGSCVSAEEPDCIKDESGKCISDDFHCTAIGLCAFIQATITTDVTFGYPDIDALVNVNTDVLMTEGGILQVDYIHISPGSNEINIRSSDQSLLTQVPWLINVGRFPLDMYGTTLPVKEYKIWNEHTYEGEHKIYYHGNWVDYVSPVHCHKGQKFCFFTGQCVDDKADMDGTCPCPLGQVKCYSDNTGVCKWSHKCFYKQALLKIDGDFDVVVEYSNMLVNENRELLKTSGILRQLDYMFMYPDSGSIMISLRSTDVKLLSDLPDMIESGQFPVDLNGNSMHVIDYTIWEEMTGIFKHRFKHNGEWVEYSPPVYCHQGQTFCFLTEKCIDDVKELDGSCPCPVGKVKCVKSDMVECVEPYHCSYQWVVLMLKGDIGVIDEGAFYEKEWSVLENLGIRHVQYIFLTTDPLMLHIRSSDPMLAEVVLTAVNEKAFPVGSDDIPIGVTALYHGHDYGGEGGHYVSYDGKLIEYQDPRQFCHQGQTFCLLTGQCVNEISPCDTRCPEGQVHCPYRNDECVDEAYCPYPTDGGNVAKIHCFEGQTFCFLTGQCVDEFNTCDSICPEGQVRCPYRNNGCVERMYCHPSTDDYGNTLKHHCHEGQTFCFLTEQCVSEFNPCQGRCPDGQVHCAYRDNECVDEAYCHPYTDYDESDIQKYHCYEGQTFCFERGHCIDDKRPCDTPCPEGQVVCKPLNNECVDIDRCPDDDRDGYSDEKSKEYCGIGQIFCFERGYCIEIKPCSMTCPEGQVVCESQNNECMDKTECDKYTDKSGNFDDPPKEYCHRGQMFCLERGHCVDIEPCDLSCPEGQVVCASRNNECVDNTECPSSVDNDKDGLSHEAPRLICQEGKIFCFHTEQCVDVTKSCDASCPVGQILCESQNNTCVAQTECATANSDAGDNSTRNGPTEYCLEGQLFCFATQLCVDEQKVCDTSLSCPEDQPVWCEETNACVAEGICGLSSGKDVFIIWATLSREEPFFDIVSPLRLLNREEQLNTFKDIAKPKLQSVLDAATLRLTVTGVTAIPGRKDGNSVALIAIAEAERDVLSITNVTDALVGADISRNLQILEVEAWKALGNSAPTQIIPSTDPLVYDKEVQLELSFLPMEILTILPGLTLDCSGDDGIMIKVTENYRTVADFSSSQMTFKATVESTQYAKCEILNLPAEITGNKRYYIGFVVLSKDLLELSNINHITASDISLDEDSDCQALPADLFSFGYEGDTMASLFLEPKWPQHALDVQENWIDPLRVAQTMERVLLEYFSYIEEEKPYLIASLSLSEGSTDTFNDEPIVRFRYKGENLERIDRSQVLFNPLAFKYCLAADFSGPIQLEVIHWPSTTDTAVTGTINLQVNPSNDRPKGRADSEIVSGFSFPKVSSSNPAPEFTVGEISSLWFSDIDMITDANIHLGLGILGSVAQSNTIGGQWEYYTGQVWEQIQNVQNAKDLDATSENTVSALLLTSDQKIRFSPDAEFSSVTWELNRSPALALFAWDQSNIESLTGLPASPVTLEKCRRTILQSYPDFCVEGESYSNEIKVVKLPREGCDGQAGSGKVETQCGCGKPEDSCVDCSGTVNGGAEIDKCGICSGGRTGITVNSEVNCEDTECRSKNVELCEIQDSVSTSISNLCPEGQIVNECITSRTVYEQCVNDTSTFVDECGINCGLNECLDCEGTPNGGKQRNPCGECRDPASLNEGCESLGDIEPVLSFTYGTMNLSVRVSDIITISNSSTITCQLVPEDPVEGQVTPDLTVIKFAAGTITSTVTVAVENKEKSAGLYAVQCNIDGTVVSSGDSGQYHRRYLHPSLDVISPADLLYGSFPQFVTIHGSGFYDTGHVYCIIPNDNGQFLTASGLRASDTEIQCDLGRLRKKLKGATYSLYVILDKLKYLQNELTSLTSPLSFTVKLPAPTLVSARFHSKKCDKIVIKFNSRISGAPGAENSLCSNYFNSDSLAILQSATCEISGGKLVIKKAVNVAIDMVLTIIDNAVKQEKETLNNPNYFTGPVTIAASEDRIIPEVYISRRIPKAIGCKKQRMKLVMKKMQCWNAEIAWTATVEDTSDPAVISKLDALESSMNGLEDFILEASQLPDVPVSLKASWNLTHVHTAEKIEGSEEITVQKEDVVLEIGGVEPLVEAYKALRPKGKIKSCLLDPDLEIVKTWTLEPPGIYNKFGNTFRPKIPRSILPSDTDLNLTLSVTMGTTAVSNFVTFRTMSILPEAAILYKGATASEEEEAELGDELQLSCVNIAENADLSGDVVSVTWTGMDNVFESESGELFPMLDPESLGSENAEAFRYIGAELNIPWDDMLSLDEGFIQQWTCTMQQGTNSSTASTRLIYTDASELQRPDIHVRPTSAGTIIVKEGDTVLRIKTFCRYTTSYEWFSTSDTGEEMLLVEPRAAVMERAEGDEDSFKSCSLKLDLSNIQLLSDVLYPVTLRAVNERNGESVANLEDFVIQYVTRPGPGVVQAIYDGDIITALTEPVSFALYNWDANGDDVTNLRCKLYYLSTDSDTMERLTTTFISVDDMVDDITFPAGEYNVQATCCNPLDTDRLCTTVLMEGTLSVTPPDLSNFFSLLQSIRIQVLTGDTTYIIAIISVKKSTGLSAEEKTETDEVAIAGIQEELDAVGDLDEIEPESSIESLQNINDIAGVLEGGTEIDDQTRTQVQEVVVSTAQSFSGQTGTSRRRKRQTESSSGSGMTVSQAETLLGAFDYLITGEPVSKDTAEAFKEVIDPVMLQLCEGYTGSTAWVARSTYATVRVIQMSLSGQDTTQFDVSCPNCSTVTYPAKVVYGADIESTYGSTEVCVASAQILVDTVSPTGTGVQPTRMSDIVVLKLISQEGITETVTGLPSQSVVTTLILNNSTINETAYDYVCKMWISEQWSDAECATSEPVLDGETSTYSVQCSCDALGTLGVFRELKPDFTTTTTTEEPTTTTTVTQTTTTVTVTTTTAAPSVPLQSTTIYTVIRFTCTDNYAANVVDETAFKSHIKSQLSTQTGISTASLKKLTVEPGSILVSFELQAYSSSGQTLGQMLYTLKNGIESGSITLTNTQGNSLTIDTGSFSYQEVAASSSSGDSEDKGNTGIIVGAALGGLAIIGIVVVIVVFIMKKYAQPKTHPIGNPSQGGQGYDLPPAYQPPPPPPYIYSSPSTHKPYPETNKWIENELSKGLVPADRGSRPVSASSVNKLLGGQKDEKEPTPVG